MLRQLLSCALMMLPLTGICQKKALMKPTEGKVDYKHVGAPMPMLRTVSDNKSVVTDKMVSNDANLVVMMFNPTCEHCEDMTSAIEKNIFLFKKTHVVLVAGAMMTPYLDLFRKNMKLDQYPGIKMGVDSSQFIDNTFRYEGLPQVNIYDHDRKLLKTFSGITTIDSIKAFIE